MSNLPRLSFINLSYNLIEEISDLTFNKNMELKVLDLSHNVIRWLNEYTLIGLEALEVTISVTIMQITVSLCDMWNES